MNRRVSTAPRPTPEAGFTMIEVLIALTILLLGIAGLLSMQVSSMRATSFSRHATEASMLAEDKMEALRTSPIASLDCTIPANCTDLVNSQGVVTELPTPPGIYTRVWSSAAVITGTGVTVEVSWSEQGGEVFTITMNTVMQ